MRKGLTSCSPSGAARLIRVDKRAEPATTEMVASTPDKQRSKRGAPSKDPERLELMRFLLLTKHNNNEDEARTAFIAIVAKESRGKGEGGQKGLTGLNHARRLWRRLRPAPGNQRAVVKVHKMPKLISAFSAPNKQRFVPRF